MIISHLDMFELVWSKPVTNFFNILGYVAVAHIPVFSGP